MKIKLRASDSCERGHRHGEWALGSNVKLMAGIGVPVPAVNDGAIAEQDRDRNGSERSHERSPNADIYMSWENSDMRRKRTCVACRRAIPVTARQGGGRR